MISDKYVVLSLKHRVGEAILSHLTPENVVEAYEAAQNFSVPDLGEAARELILSNWETLRKDERVMAWMASGSKLGCELFGKLRF